MTEVEFKKGDIFSDYKDFEAVAFSLFNYTEQRTETEKFFYKQFSEALELALSKHVKASGKPFLGNVITAEINSGTQLLLQMYAPKFNTESNNSELALLRACWLKAVLSTEKLGKSSLVISLNDLDFPQEQLKTLEEEFSETVKTLSTNWKNLKKVVFLA